MRVGYCRVSTTLQDEALQRDALEKAGCEQIFTDKVSGTKFDRPGLSETLKFLRKGDTLVVWKLDRAGRSIRHLIDLVNGLAEREVGFISLTEGFDTTTPGGRLIFHIFAAIAEFEHDLILERTNAGLQAARVRGRMGGRKRKIKSVSRIARIKQDHADGVDIAEICDAYNISKPTLYRYLQLPNPPEKQDEAS